MPFKPEFESEVPTLGWLGLDWISTFLAKPDSTYYEPLILTPEQAQFVLNYYRLDPVTGQRVIRRAVWSRPKKHGKAEILTAVLPTPDGWTTVGEVRAGDFVIGGDGRPTRVQQVHPVIQDRGWRVEFSDGSSSVFHADHLFTVREFTASGTRKTRTLSVGEMAQIGTIYPRPLSKGRTWANKPGVARFAIPSLPTLELPDQDLPLDPYMLGYWLGDGDSDCARFTGTIEDLQHLAAEATRRGYEPLEIRPSNTAYRLTVSGGLLDDLREAGVVDHKHIPDVYLRASVEQRLELLQGLMDSDGTISKKGYAEWSNCRESLGHPVAELIRSLGMQCKVREVPATYQSRVTSTNYRIMFTPRRQSFRLPRKLERQRTGNESRAPFPRTIRSIEPVGSHAMRCITVENSDGLYLTGETMITTHNSPLMGAIGALEAMGPVVPDGWDADGRPVGKPWSEVRTPLVQFAAVNEEQTRNAYEPLLEMIRNGPIMDYYEVDPMDSFIALPRGRIEYLTAAGMSKEGQRPVFAALDQTESWTQSNGGRKLAAVIRRNLGPLGGSSIETPNSYKPGSDSVSQKTFEYWDLIQQGKARDTGLLVDHREAPAETDLANDKSLLAGLNQVYGDSAKSAGGWVDTERIMAEIRDPDTDPQDARQFFLNQVTHASDSWISRVELMAVAKTDPEHQPKPGDQIVLGFDGSRGRVRGKPDATALVGMRIADRHLFRIGIWEKSDSDPQDWVPNIDEVNAVVDETFRKYHVVGFYADPSGWTSTVADWEVKYGSRMRVKASRESPISMWPRGKDVRITEMIKSFREAVVDLELTWDGSSAIMRHILNARRRTNRRGYVLHKEYPESPDKIDAAYAALMAYKACLDAITGGFNRATQTPVDDDSRKAVFG